MDQYFDHILVHTGQNYDYELNEVFFKEMEIEKPDHFLEIDTSSLGAAVGDILKKTEIVLKEEKPDALLVLGDTNSCLSAYIAKRMHIPVFHMEAGNRCFDFNVPEETNRRVIDHIADFNLVYTEHARRHLLSEGLPHRRIYLTGSPMKEVLDYYKENIERSDSLNILGVHPGNYFVVSVHREENVDNLNNLLSIVQVLNKLAVDFSLPVIVSTHPRTRKRLEQLTNIQIDGNIRFMKPFGFFDYVKLQKEARCTISDSGTISEESSILNFPAVSIRNSMERPEAQDTGSISLTGLMPETVCCCVEIAISEKINRKAKQVPQEYQIADCSWRVLKLIAGNTNLNRLWNC